MINRKMTLFNHGIGCITLLVLGSSNSPFIPRGLRDILFPYLLIALLLALLVSFIYQARHSKEELEREQRDERSRMILERSVWYCRQTEDWLLLGLFAVLVMDPDHERSAYLLLWVMIVRNLLTFGIRCWLERKY